MRAPRTRYARTPDGAAIAYQVFGEGPVDIALVTNWVWSIDLMWEQPLIERALLRLGDAGRVIVYDKRGNGASDPLYVQGENEINPRIEQAAHDLVAVLDEVGSERVCLAGADLGGWPAMLLAGTHPERVQSLVLQDTAARFLRTSDYPWGMPPATLERAVANIGEHWGTGRLLAVYSPTLAQDPRFVEWYGRFERLSIAPADMTGAWRDMVHFDIRGVLDSIRVPTRVILHEDAVWVRADHGRYVAERIPGAQLVTLPGAEMFFFADDAVVEEIVRFATGGSGERGRAYADRVLAAVLFTDLVSSTERLVALGDSRWRRLLDQHDAIVRRHVDRHGGRLVKSTGDGVLATFTGAARAVLAATAIRDDVARLDVGVRAGIHTGEVELRGDDVGGVAVHVAARVMGAADPGEILVSRTVKELTAGSGLRLSHRGEHRLKGMDEPWELFRVEPS